MVVHSFKSFRSTSADAAAAELPIILDVLEEAPTPKIVSKREEQLFSPYFIPFSSKCIFECIALDPPIPSNCILLNASTKMAGKAYFLS